MGTIHHTALVITSYTTNISEVHKRAINLFGDLVTEIASGINGYKSFMIAPCGSKWGWDESNNHLQNISKLMAYLDTLRYEDGSSPISYVKVSFGELGLQVQDNTGTYIEGDS